MPKTELWMQIDRVKEQFRTIVYQYLIKVGRQDMADEFMNRTNGKFIKMTVLLAMQYLDLV